MTAVDILAGALSAAAQSGNASPVIVGAFIVSFCAPALLILHFMARRLSPISSITSSDNTTSPAPEVTRAERTHHGF